MLESNKIIKNITIICITTEYIKRQDNKTINIIEIILLKIISYKRLKNIS